MRLCALIVGALLAWISPSHAYVSPNAQTYFATTPSGGGCGTGGVCVTFQAGQSFITWPDAGQCASGSTSCPVSATYRYSAYMSTAQPNSSTCASGTLIASSIANNSAQLQGGNPATGGNGYSQGTRQNSTLPQAVLSFGGTALPIYSGLQVHTATGTQTVYFCVIANPFPSGTAVYIGRTASVTEVPATPAATPIKYADSFSRGQSYGKITCGTSCGGTTMPLIYQAHASSGTGGDPPGGTVYGDFWEWFLTLNDGWQDGRAAVLSVWQDNNQHWQGEPSALLVAPRDTLWYPNYSETTNTGIETSHLGVGLNPTTPNLAAIAQGCTTAPNCNGLYLITMSGYQKFLNFAINHYGANPNNLHWTGTSMGGWGGANTGMRMTSPQFAGVWVTYPLFRFDHKGSSAWPGVTWPSGQPFTATTGSAPSTLGITASAIKVYAPGATAGGQTWGGNGNYADSPNFYQASPGTDLPFLAWSGTKNDGYSFWPDYVLAVNAMEAANRGYAFAWSFGDHGSDNGAGDIIDGIIDCDQGSNAQAAYCYSKNTFQLNKPYLAISNSSINDNPGTGNPQSNGLYDGAYAGLMNAGFSWSITTDTSTNFNFTVSNSWMGQTPTADPTTTLQTAITATGGATVNVASTAGFTPVTTGAGGSNVLSNPYILVSGTEVMCASSFTTTTITFGAGLCNIGSANGRAQAGTTAHTHAIGDTVEQILKLPTGPGGGPYTSMHANITPRRIQNFLPASGHTVTCSVTPNGGSPSNFTATVQATRLWTLTAIPIQSSGSTSANCTHS